MIREDLWIDSMQAIETMSILERELKIVIDSEKAMQVTRIEDMFRLVEGYVNQPSA